jgi:hypothetical protein
MSVESLFGMGLALAYQIEPPEELSAKLNAVAVSVRGGICLRDAAALQRIGHRRLAAWVKLGDDGHEPWAAFLVGLCREAAAERVETLRGLSELAALDTGAARDLRRMGGAATDLQRELDMLRRVDTASRDARAERSQLEGYQRKRGLEALGKAEAK